MTEEERLRYSRQMRVAGIGESGQKRLRDSKVFIAGCGALGSMIAMQLAGAGVGSLMIADFDTIDISNLQRQFFFQTDESGMHKAEVLAQRIRALNPGCYVEECLSLVNKSIGERLFRNCDFVVDATDNGASKRMIEAVCRQLGLPCCIGGVSGFRGQVMTVLPATATFGEVFGEGEDEGMLPCSVEGVVGPAAALCASIQASEVIKYLTGCGETLANKLLAFDLLTDDFSKIEL